MAKQEIQKMFMADHPKVKANVIVTGAQAERTGRVVP
jgi:hypothetical protein